MKQRTDLLTEDLLVNESFLNYYFRNDEADIWEWEEHATDHPSHQAVIAEAISILDRLSLKWGEAKIRREFLRLQESLVTAEATTNIRSLNRLSINRFALRWVAGLAASLLLVAGFWWLNAYPSTTGSPIYRQLVAGKSLIEHVNTTAQPMPLTLPDGSTVQLYGQSRLSYPAQFTPEKREIYLDGEAFFEVKKDAQKPFFVYANSLVTRVLGTSFTVIARPGQATARVVVRTGKVSVYQQTGAQKTQTGEGIVVTQNQQIRFEQKAAQFTRTLVDTPLPVQPLPPHSFDFTNAPAATVFAQLQRAYGITMVYDEAHLRHCPVTATLTDEPLYGKLDLICRAIEARYEVIDGQIIISGGCAD